MQAADLFATLPADWPSDPLPAIREERQARSETVVVLDDDPTGTQTVHGVPVLTRWTQDLLRHELAAGPPAIFLLTNSRSLPRPDAVALNREIGGALAAAGRATGRRYVVISRGDSTLRGHYPAETDALAAGLGTPIDAGTLLVPAFITGGRYTIGNIHYVAEGTGLVPAARTPFARDPAFGYRSSDLAAWVEEKSEGRIPAALVRSISIETIRGGGPDRVAAALAGLERGSVCVVNAASERDLAVAALGAMRAESQGKRFLYRTAASFVRARAGLEARPLLTAADLAMPRSGAGLIIVGSYVPSTSSQIAALRESGRVTAIEVAVERLLSPGTRADEIGRVARLAGVAIRRGDDTAVVTSRELVAGHDAAGSLAIGQLVSESLVAIVRAIPTRPRYLLAKGGITSSDLATAGLGVTRAMVLGQLAPGVSVWRLGLESRYPGLPYIVFPGNVGEPGAFLDVVSTLRPPE
ncbi:MAG TPA: four-carbon acid sugar kinase family protein [Chloroflexota bacterium]|nr:four-carbon acid sugar kinase family protein [Chloroflexota bacterium]